MVAVRSIDMLNLDIGAMQITEAIIFLCRPEIVEIATLFENRHSWREYPTDFRVGYFRTVYERFHLYRGTALRIEVSRLLRYPGHHSFVLKMNGLKVDLTLPERIFLKRSFMVRVSNEMLLRNPLEENSNAR